MSGQNYRRTQLISRSILTIIFILLTFIYFLYHILVILIKSEGTIRKYSGGW